MKMRRAHVLMELVVVITLLMVAAAIAGPRIISAMSRPRVEDARAKLRADLEFTRARAVSTGLRHQFLLDSSTGKISALAFHPDEMNNTGGAAANSEDVVLQDQLPDEVKATWEPQIGLGNVQQSTGANTTVSEVITFYPEGNGDGVLVTFEDRDGARCGLELNGYTGQLRDLTSTELSQR
jgi:Tfp pilus assembly protein FimT